MEYDMSEREYELLELLEEYDVLRISQIAEKLGWKEELARRCTAELENKGLVKTQYVHGGEVHINKKVKIGDMLNLDNIDLAVLKEFNIKTKDEAKVMKDVLDYVWEHPGCTTNDIIKSLGVSPELVNKALQTLSEKGEIEQAVITEE